MSRRFHPGPHELGQNLLIDAEVARRVAGLVAARPGPIIEWAGGSGALTRPLARLGRPLEVVEIDPRAVSRLRKLTGGQIQVTQADILRHEPLADPYDLVCNVPFHITTAVLRRLFRLPAWQRAVLITQWEVARKRAAVGGATMMTVQWWPWFTFRLDSRVPARAFRPRPSVDAGILEIDRRPEPLIASGRRRAYLHFVAAAFRAGGGSLPRALGAAGLTGRRARRYLQSEGIPTRARIGDLTPRHWVELFELTSGRRPVNAATLRGPKGRR